MCRKCFLSIFMVFIINQMLLPPLQSAQMYRLQYFFSSLSILWKCFSTQKSGSRLRRVLNFSRLDSLMPSLRCEIKCNEMWPIELFFSPDLSGTELSTQLCSTSYFIFFPSGQRCTARQGDVEGTRRMDPVGTVNTSPTRKHWAARCVFHRCFLNFAERKWPGEEEQLVCFLNPPPSDVLEQALFFVGGQH